MKDCDGDDGDFGWRVWDRHKVATRTKLPPKTDLPRVHSRHIEKRKEIKMTVLKTFLKVLNKCKVPIILYTVILIAFGGFNMQTSENSTNFVASEPDVLIINQDKEEGVTKNLIEYIEKNSEIKEVKDNQQAIDDALFYRDVNYIIYIPENYREDFLHGQNPEIKIKSTGDYQASLAEMMLERYVKRI